MYVNGWLLFGGMGLVLFGLCWLALNGRDTAEHIDQIGEDLDRSVRDLHRRFEEVDHRIDRGEGWTLHLIDDYRARVGAAPVTEPIPVVDVAQMSITNPISSSLVVPEQPPTEPISKVLIGHWEQDVIDPGVVGPVEAWPREPEVEGVESREFGGRQFRFRTNEVAVVDDLAEESA